MALASLDVRQMGPFYTTNGHQGKQ